MKLTKIASLVLAGFLALNSAPGFAAAKAQSNVKAQKVQKSTKSSEKSAKKAQKSQKQSKAEVKQAVKSSAKNAKSTAKKNAAKAEKKSAKRSKARMSLADIHQEREAAKKKATPKETYVVASYYGGKFHGRLTANGEIYNKNAMTAAHRTLPFGTFLKVTNTRNGRSVVVRVNDRGPYISGRSIDLSEGAARAIGMISSGVGKVKLEILSAEQGRKSRKAVGKSEKNTKNTQEVKNAKSGTKNSEKTSAALRLTQAKFALSVAVKNEKEAQRLAKQIKQKAYIRQNGKQYQVVIDTADAQSADKVKRQLAKLGFRQVNRYAK